MKIVRCATRPLDLSRALLARADRRLLAHVPGHHRQVPTRYHFIPLHGPVSSPRSHNGGLMRLHLVVRLACVANLAACQANHPQARAPSTSTIPFVGEQGVDAWGRPLRMVDLRRIRALRQAHQFGELTRLLEAIQAAVEADCRLEAWALEAFDAAAATAYGPEAQFDEWERATPSSYVPALVRGVSVAIAGHEARGRGFASVTTSAQFEEMHRILGRGRALLEATTLSHDTQVARRAWLQLEMWDGGTDEVRLRQLHAGLALCPSSLAMREMYQLTLRPRWGGSYAQMQAFARAQPTAQYPVLAVLAGFSDLDQAELHFSADRADDAIRACDEALKTGPYWEFLQRKGMTLLKSGKTAEALPVLVETNRLRPMNVATLSWLAFAYRDSGRLHEASEVFQVTRAIEPGNPRLKNFDFGLSAVLLRPVQELLAQRRFAEAEVRIEESRRLTPRYNLTLKALGQLQEARGDVPAALETWRSIRGLDLSVTALMSDALMRSQRNEEALALWNELLQTTSDLPAVWEGRARLFQQMGEPARAASDLAEACRRGKKSACN